MTSKDPIPTPAAHPPMARPSLGGRLSALTDRAHARLAGLRGARGGFTTPPEPRGVGSVARGRQLVRGNFLFAGYLIEAPETSIWDLPVPDTSFESELHGFAWLDDLAALGDAAANARARDWTLDWARRFGGGSGPGWTADLTGRRLIRWIDHAGLLLRGNDAVRDRLFHRALARQATFLARRRQRSAHGLPRFEALAGLVQAGVWVAGMDRHIAPAIRALGAEAAAYIDARGAIPTRNPEEAMEVFALLAWSANALRERKLAPHPDHVAALARMAPTLRALRHADGGLARFHGGGRGGEGHLDQALALSGVRAGPAALQGMGFARLAHGRTTLILDAAAPPAGPASAQAHASTLAFEVTSGRRPLIVNCGSGRTFGAKWRRAGRATPSHSTLAIDGVSSARLGVQGVVAGRHAELLADAPRDVRIERRRTETGTGLIAGHDGYVATHGLTHVRQVYLSHDGRGLQGEDVLTTLEPRDEATFDRAVRADAGRGSGRGGGWGGGRGIDFRIRFHLHPDVIARPEEDGQSILLVLRSGEVWEFRHAGAAAVSLERSVYLETSRHAPRATSQIVLSSTATEYATRVAWTLAKARQTPDAVRDLVPDHAGDDPSAGA